MSTVLIYSSRTDHHAQYLQQQLANQHIDCVILERYTKQTFISHQFVNTQSHTDFCISGKRYDLDKDIMGIYWWPTPLTNAEKGQCDATQEEIEGSQAWWLSAAALLDNKKINVVNPVYCALHASNKVLQLNLARALSLNVPKTIITNSLKDAQQYMKKQKTIAIKKMTQLLNEDSLPSYTKKTNAQVFFKAQHRTNHGPYVFQEHIDKQYELRIYVIGQKAYSVKIILPDTIHMQTDWRRYYADAKYEPAVIPHSLTMKLVDFNKHFGLTYAAFDFIVDNNGQYIFLECNPDGSWLHPNYCQAENIAKELINQLTKNLFNNTQTNL